MTLKQKQERANYLRAIAEEARSPRQRADLLLEADRLEDEIAEEEDMLAREQEHESEGDPYQGDYEEWDHD